MYRGTLHAGMCVIQLCRTVPIALAGPTVVCSPSPFLQMYSVINLLALALVRQLQFESYVDDLLKCNTMEPCTPQLRTPVIQRTILNVQIVSLQTSIHSTSSAADIPLFHIVGTWLGPIQTHLYSGHFGKKFADSLVKKIAKELKASYSATRTANLSVLATTLCFTCEVTYHIISCSDKPHPRTSIIPEERTPC